VLTPGRSSWDQYRLGPQTWTSPLSVIRNRGNTALGAGDAVAFASHPPVDLVRVTLSSVPGAVAARYHPSASAFAVLSSVIEFSSVLRPVPDKILRCAVVQTFGAAPQVPPCRASS
jgi:hypothetical protein